MTSEPGQPRDSPGRGREGGVGQIAYSIIPAAGYHFLTPIFDLLTVSVGVGLRFREHVLVDAGIVDGARVLDVGCGSGSMVLLIKKRYPGCSVVGVDADARILKRALRRVPAGSSIRFVQAPAEQTGLGSGLFDMAVSTLVFHHLPAEGKEAAAIEVARLLRPGGIFLLVDIGPLRPVRRSMTAAERRDPRHGFRTNTPQSLDQALRSAGFTVRRACPPFAWALRPWTFALRCEKR